MKNQRRHFIKNSIQGMAGLLALPKISYKNVEHASQEKETAQKVIYRTLGKTGIKLPVISAGLLSTDENIYRAALDRGVVYIDGGYDYGNGMYETAIGKSLKGRARDSFIVSTKIGGEPQDPVTGLFTEDTDIDLFFEHFETSLKRLDVDYVDILYLHSISNKEALSFEPLVKAMQKLKSEERARFLGITTHRNEAEVLRGAADSGIYDVAMTAYNFRQAHKEEMKEAISYASSRGLGVVAMKVMAGSFWDTERQNRINAKAALKWVLQNEDVTTTVPAFVTYAQMEENLSVMEDLALTAEERSDLKLGDRLNSSGLYCSQCENCLSQCPRDLQIPDLMRSYMYAYGYHSASKAQATLETAAPSRNFCQDCSTCAVSCTMGFDVKNKIENILRLKDVPKDFLS